MKKGIYDLIGGLLLLAVGAFCLGASFGGCDCRLGHTSQADFFEGGLRCMSFILGIALGIIGIGFMFSEEILEDKNEI